MLFVIQLADLDTYLYQCKVKSPREEFHVLAEHELFSLYTESEAEKQGQRYKEVEIEC